MYATIRKNFAKIAAHRANNTKIPLVEALLVFDEQRCEEP
jgi:hypothetical protein